MIKRANPVFILTGLFIILILVAALSVYIGPTSSRDPVILWQIRLPRVFLGLIVGFSLSAVGAIFQSLLRNPLADPYVLGTSSGACVGALLGLELRNLFPEHVILSAFSFYILVFLGAFGATITSYLMARTEKQVPIVNLVLSGVIVTTLCSAFIMLFFTLQHHDSFSVFFFLLGSLLEGSWNLIAVSSIIIFLGTGAAYLYARDLDVLSLGEEKAASLGIEVEKLKLTLFGIGSLIVSAAVAVSGTIGFVGLIVPHMARLIIGPKNRILIPASALMGGILLILADSLARTIAKPIEIPVGIIMSLAGAPFFLWLLKRKQKTKYF